MREKRLYIGIVVANMLFFAACSDHEVISSYQEIKEAELVPIQFTPYVGTHIEEEATTRADVNYLSNMKNDNTDGMGVFSSFPWYNATTHTGSHTGAKAGAPDFRFGSWATNSYIVGMYGYYGQDASWGAMKDDDSLTANFMTNQPLLHTSSSVWEYSPLRYWPNTADAKVTFISYYPFQDFNGNEFYRNGQVVDAVEYADLTCIEPPANDAVGKDAYTFTFTQHTELEKQVDFLLGINTDVGKQGVSAGNVSLNLRHTLCAVVFDIRSEKIKRLEDGTNFSGDVKYEINSISLEGLYGKGKVYPIYEGGNVVINWECLGEDNAKYTLAFNDATMFNNHFTRPTFTGENRVSKHFIYNNSHTKEKDKGTVTIEGNSVNYETVDLGAANSRNMKYLMMVIPQKAETDKDGNPKDAYLVVNYDFSYTAAGQTVYYKNCEEKIKLSDTQFHKDAYKGQLFRPGVLVSFNIFIQGLKSISMDASVFDWDEGVTDYTPPYYYDGQTESDSNGDSGE